MTHAERSARAFEQARSCPACGDDEIYRSMMRGALERAFHWIWRVRPYRCNACYRRFWRADTRPRLGATR